MSTTPKRPTDAELVALLRAIQRGYGIATSDLVTGVLRSPEDQALLDRIGSAADALEASPSARQRRDGNMRQLILTHNNAVDHVLRVDNNVVVSEWAVTPSVLRQLLETDYVGDWDVQDRSGLTGDVSDYGEIVAARTEDHPLVVHDNDLWCRRLEFYGVAAPRAARFGHGGTVTCDQ